MKSKSEHRETKAQRQLARSPEHVSEWNQRQSGLLSHRSRILLLTLFCIISGGCSGWLLIEGLTGKPIPVFSIEPIRTPQHTGRTGEAGLAVISSREYERISRYKNYMDSLARSPSGKRLHDSLTGNRPGLMDSIAAIEAFYYQQNGKAANGTLHRQDNRR